MTHKRNKSSISNDLTAIKVILAEVEHRLARIKPAEGTKDMADKTSILSKISDLNAEVDVIATKHAGGISAIDAQAIEDALTALTLKLQGLATA